MAGEPITGDRTGAESSVLAVGGPAIAPPPLPPSGENCVDPETCFRTMAGCNSCLIENGGTYQCKNGVTVLRLCEAHSGILVVDRLCHDVEKNPGPGGNEEQRWRDQLFNGFARGLGHNGVHIIGSTVRPGLDNDGAVPFVLFARGANTVGAGGCFIATIDIGQDLAADKCGLTFFTGAGGASTAVSAATNTPFEGRTAFKALCDLAKGLDITSTFVKVRSRAATDDNQGTLFGGSSPLPLLVGSTYCTPNEMIASVEGDRLGVHSSRGRTARGAPVLVDYDDGPLSGKSEHSSDAYKSTFDRAVVIGTGLASGAPLEVEAICYGSLQVDPSENCWIRVPRRLPTQEEVNALAIMDREVPRVVDGNSFKSVARATVAAAKRVANPALKAAKQMVVNEIKATVPGATMAIDGYNALKPVLKEARHVKVPPGRQQRRRR